MQDTFFNIAVCDDEEIDRINIAEMTKEICRQEQIKENITCFSGANELLHALKMGEKYQMILLDVIMPEQNGIELARLLRKENMDVLIVFISYDREMALKGYEVSASRYLAKPLKEEQLREAIQFCYTQKPKYESLFLPIKGGMKKIFSKEIYYIEIHGRKCKVVFAGEEWDTSLSMEQLEEMLKSQGFTRCHQSFLVNCRYIRILRFTHLELTDGRQIPVSKYRLKEVREIFFRYMEH